jgi:hypothetical protein
MPDPSAERRAKFRHSDASGARSIPVKRRAAIPFALATLALLAGGGACDDEQAPCKVDTDCPQGQICREERCGPVGGDAAAPPEAAPPPTCLTEGTTCGAADECCSQTCTDGRCASSVAPPATCRSAFELCQNDCCAGLTCTAGVCR